ncbi:hypothetical protein FTX61_18430 [Nitriliruptoraceae bacterium ZYF776]|nr:hypothetical protein [Profundirhabdus halotolerans]
MNPNGRPRVPGGTSSVAGPGDGTANGRGRRADRHGRRTAPVRDLHVRYRRGPAATLRARWVPEYLPGPHSRV